jgi:hypothetical protein
VVLPTDTILVQSQFNDPAAQVFGLWHPLLEHSRAVYRGPGAMKADLNLVLQDRRPDIVLMDPEMQRELGHVPPDGWPGSIRVWLDFSPEPLPSEVAGLLGEDGAAYCHGFAPEELGLIVCMNTNDPNSMIPHHLPQIGNRRGTTGRILPGFSARLVRDGAEVSLFGSGELEVRGGPLPPDWHGTGISGSFDREGFFTPGSGSATPLAPEPEPTLPHPRPPKTR